MQMAADLPAQSVRLNAKVVRVEPGCVQLDTGESIQASAIVLAVEGSAAAGLLPGSAPTDAQGVTCLYFAADHAPIEEPILVLNGEGHGLVNNLCVPSLVAPSYAPDHQHLISATVLGITHQDETRLQAAVRDQLAEWFGAAVQGWRHLRTYRIPYALPRQIPPALSMPERPVRWQPGLYLCGDYRDNASIQGALVSGRRAAEAVLEDRR